MCINFKSLYLTYSAIFYFFVIIRQVYMSALISSKHISWVGVLIDYNWYMSFKFTSLVTFRGEIITSLHAGNSLMQGVKLLMDGYSPKRTWTADTHVVLFIPHLVSVYTNVFTRLSTRLIHAYSTVRSVIKFGLQADGLCRFCSQCVPCGYQKYNFGFSRTIGQFLTWYQHSRFRLPVL